MKIDAEFWTMIGAIGQWLAAGATVWAIWTALRADRPKPCFIFLIQESLYPKLPIGSPGEEALKVIVVNHKPIPIKVIEKGFLICDKKFEPKYNIFEVRDREEIFKIDSGKIWERLTVDNCRDFELLTCYIVDYAGRRFSKSVLFDIKNAKFIIISGFRLHLYCKARLLIN